MNDVRLNGQSDLIVGAENDAATPRSWARRDRGLIRVALGLVVGSAGWASTCEGVTLLLPDATYSAGASSAGNPTPLQTGPHPLEVPYSWSGIVGGVTEAQAHASASTRNGGALSDLKVEALGSAQNISAGSSAEIDFYVAAIQTAPAPVDDVPILVTFTMQGNVHALALNGGMNARALAGLSILGANIQAGGATKACLTGPAFDADEECVDSFNQLYSIPGALKAGLALKGILTASSSAQDLGGDQHSVSWSAVADPTIVIDPAFPYKDDFRLAFSSNLLAVPEAATPFQLLVGFAALGILRYTFSSRNRCGHE